MVTRRNAVVTRSAVCGNSYRVAYNVPKRNAIKSASIYTGKYTMQPMISITESHHGNMSAPIKTQISIITLFVLGRMRGLYHKRFTVFYLQKSIWLMICLQEYEGRQF